MSGGFAARLLLFRGLVSSCAVCGSSVRTLGVCLHAASGLVGHLQHLGVDGTLKPSEPGQQSVSLLDGTTAMNTGQGVCIAFVDSHLYNSISLIRL
ncbi:hypothetical protein PF003_g41049 [Phytophthora fragariae]|nr:hypothetical protein PF003_g41049 [Phytophthora fragariae]